MTELSNKFLEILKLLVFLTQVALALASMFSIALGIIGSVKTYKKMKKIKENYLEIILPVIVLAGPGIIYFWIGYLIAKYLNVAIWIFEPLTYLFMPSSIIFGMIFIHFLWLSKKEL